MLSHHFQSLHRLPLLFAAALITVSCSSGGGGSDPTDEIPDENQSGLPALASDLAEPVSHYTKDGYDTIDLLTVNLTTAIAAGACDTDDISGCTLDDINNDTDGNDDFKPKINVHLVSSDYPEDNLVANAELKQRGDTSRQAEQKSYSVRLEKDLPLWRNERRLQLNKHPFDQERIRNKLSFDLMKNIDHLNSLRTQFVHLFIEDNGQQTDYGLFTHVERVGKNYTQNRGYEKDSPIYKTVNFKFERLEDRLQINSDGSPVDKDLFERNLEIEEGEDHRPLIAMLDALNDPDADQQAVLDKYFNENNIITWLAVNILLGNANSVFENYYLFNPKDSDRFYYLPWDYDGAFKTELHPDEDTGEEQRRRRMEFGVSKWWDSVLIRSWLSQPGSYDKLKSHIKTLANGALSEATIKNLIESYKPIVQEVLANEPDITHLEGTTNQGRIIEWLSHVDEMPGRVKTNFDAFNNDPGWPMAFALFSAEVAGSMATFSWAPSFDFQGDTISYHLELSDTPQFTNTLFNEDSIAHSPVKNAGEHEKIIFTADIGSLTAGTYYWRVTATDDRDPENNWRPAYEIIKVDGVRYYGSAILEIQ